MAVNLFKNPSFEEGWYHPGDVAELQIPNKWAFTFKPDESVNPISAWPLFRPECRVMPKSQIPEHEWPLFFWGGDYALKWFGFHKCWQAALMQQVTLERGVHRMSVGAYPDVYSSGNPKEPAGDPLTAMIRFFWLTNIDATYSKWLTMKPYLVKQPYMWDILTLGDSGLAGWEVRMGHPVQNTGVFFDDAAITQTGPIPGTEDCDHQVHRVDYPRYAVVLPKYASREQGHAVLDEIWDDKRSLEFSVDDGMYAGDLTDNTTEIKGELIVVADYDAFRDEHYPGTKLLYTPLPGEGAVPPPPPPPPPNKRPDVAGWLGVHQLQHHPSGWGEFQQNGPPLVKTVNDIGQLIWAYGATPDKYKPLLKLVFRRYHPDEGGASYRYNPDKREAATNWISYVCGDLTMELKEAGIPTSQVIVLGLNEVWEHDAANNQHSIDFDLEAIRALEIFNKLHGTEYSYGLSSMAVGNTWMPSEPGGEEQWQKIKPLARYLKNNGGEHACFNYHAYGILIKERPEAIANYARFLQERWVEMWDWLKANGVESPFVHGEGGQVVGSAEPLTASVRAAVAFASATDTQSAYKVVAGGEVLTLHKRRPLFRKANPDVIGAAGLWLNPGRGWCGTIPWQRAEDELIAHWDERWEIINKERDYQASFGVTPFQAGDEGDWAGFNYAGDPLFSLSARQHSRWRL